MNALRTILPSILACFVMLGVKVVSPSAQTFEAFLAQVNAVPESQRQALVDSFLATVRAFPFVEPDTLAHFIYAGNASGVTVPGDANQWDPAAFPMQKIAGTTFWYHTHIFESDARLDYKFVLNGSNWILDPRNPNQVTGGFGANSELRMPAYVPPEEIKFNPQIPHGTLRDTTFFSTELGNSRTVRVYLPPLYESSHERYPVILLHDGLEYISLANANNVIDNLIADNRIRPLIAVFVPPVNRTQEYAGAQQNAFTSFIVNDIMAWLDARYRTLPEPAHRAVMGASNGGNISLWFGFSYPEVFGNIAAQSSNVEGNILSGFTDSDKLGLRFYFDLGTYDIPIVVERVHNFLPVLAAKGYAIESVEYHEGHSWGSWRAHIDDVLELFFPPVATGVGSAPEKPRAFQLMQNYPNPFNPETTIGFSLAQPAVVLLAIYNLRGQHIRTLVNEHLPGGTHTRAWDGTREDSTFASTGTYFYQLRVAGTVVDTKKLVLVK